MNFHDLFKFVTIHENYDLHEFSQIHENRFDKIDGNTSFREFSLTRKIVKIYGNRENSTILKKNIILSKN